MLLIVKTFAIQEYAIEVENSDLIIEVKQKIENDIGIAVEQQRLIFAGRKREDENCQVKHGRMD